MTRSKTSKPDEKRLKRQPTPTPDDRMMACTAVIFGQNPVQVEYDTLGNPRFFTKDGRVPTGSVIAPELAAEFDRARTAKRDGSNRHAGTKQHQPREAGWNWRPVFDSIAAADPSVLRTPIEEKRVRAVLATLEQTREVKGAADIQRYKTFIKWVRRGLKRNELRLPPPPVPAVPPDYVYDGEDGSNM